MTIKPITHFVAGKAVILREGTVLLLREAGSYQDGTHEGQYDVPGGRCNAGEAFATGLAREVREETGLQLLHWQPFFINDVQVECESEIWHITRIFCRCQVSDGDVKLSGDHDHAAWVPLDKLTDWPMIENLREVFAKLS